MRCLIVLCLLEALILVHHTHSAPPKTETLALWNFVKVAECELHYSPIVYIGYGCWCGIGCEYKPVDEIDSCCMNHHKCYKEAVSNNTCHSIIWELVDNYKWECTNGTAVCSEHNHRCQSALCACDVAVAKCLSEYPKPAETKKCIP